MYSFNTASGKYCCNWFNSSTNCRCSYEVSIPQAVSTVATLKSLSKQSQRPITGFNTASGKYCCNLLGSFYSC